MLQSQGTESFWSTGIGAQKSGFLGSFGDGLPMPALSTSFGALGAGCLCGRLMPRTPQATCCEIHAACMAMC